MGRAHMSKLLTERAVEAGYGIPVRTLQGRRQRGLPPEFVKVGTRVYYPVQAVEDWLAASARTTTKAAEGQTNG